MKGIQLRQELMLDLLQMREISTRRQMNNGTRIFELPIKKYGQFIEVGSFKSGYVRRMNGGYTPYQLNKCENYDHFYKAYEWQTKGSKHPSGQEQVWTGKYNKFVGKKRILIPNELDRLEYLIAFCLKNYYINQANMIEDGKFVPKWKHEYEMKNGNIDRIRELQEENRELRKRFEETAMELDELTVTVNGHKYRVI